MEPLSAAFAMVQSPAATTREEGEHRLEMVGTDVLLGAVTGEPLVALQAALYLKVKRPMIAGELCRLLCGEGAPPLDPKVSSVLGELLASLLYQHWPQNHPQVLQLFLTLPTRPVHLSLFKCISKEKTTHFYDVCEQTTAFLAPSLGTHPDSDLLLSHTAKYVSHLPETVYLYGISTAMQQSPLTSPYQSMLIKRISLFPSDLLPVYDRLIDQLLPQTVQNPLFSLRIYTKILSSPIFSPSGLILTQSDVVFPCPFAHKVTEETLFQLINFAIEKCASLNAEKLGNSEELLEIEQFENKKYDIRPCAAEFLTVLYENSEISIQNRIFSAVISILTSEITPESALSAIFQVFFPQKEAILYSFGPIFKGTVQSQSILAQITVDLTGNWP